MSYQTLEVELDHGHISPIAAEVLPVKARALLTILDTPAPAQVGESNGVSRSLGAAMRELEVKSWSEYTDLSTGAEPSLADLGRDFLGIGNGTHTDLSTNKRHMDDFGK